MNEEVKQTIRNRAIDAALSVNNVLSREYLEQLDDQTLLAFCHPSDREAFAVKMGYSVKQAHELLYNYLHV